MPKVLGAAAQLCLNLVLLQFFEPADYGILSVCIAGIVLVDAVLGSALDMAILRLAPAHAAEGRDVEALEAQQAAFILKPVGGLLLAGLIAVQGAALSNFLFHRPDESHLLLMSAVALIGLQVLRSIQAHFQVNHRFVLYGVADLAHNVLRFGGIAVLLAASWHSVTAILALYALAPVIVCAALLGSGARQLASALPRSASFREFGSVILWYLPAAAVGSLLARIDLFMVARLAGVSDAGIYSAAQLLVIAPQMLGSYLAVVFGPKIMPKYHDGTLGPFYRRTQVALFAVSAVLLVAFAVAFKWLAPYVLPEEYRGALGIMLILLPSTLAPLVNYPLCVQLLLFLRPKTVLGFDMACAIPVVFAYHAAIGAFGAIGAAAVTVGFAVVKTAFLQGFAWRVVGGSGPPQVAAKNLPAFLRPAGRVEHSRGLKE